MGKKSRSNARKLKAQCITCWNHSKIRAVHCLEYLRKTHIDTMNKPRTSQCRLVRIPHDSMMNIKPSQMQPFIHYYPVKDDKVITEPARSKKQQSILSLTSSKSISVAASKDIIVPIASHKARNNTINRKRKREEMKETDDVLPAKKRQKVENPIKQCLQNQLNIAINDRNLLSMDNINEEISGIESNEANMSDSQIIDQQKQIINSLSKYITLQNFNALSVAELLIREHLEGYDIKVLDREYQFCRYCETYIGGDIYGCYQTGKPFINGCDSQNVHIRDPEQFINIKNSWSHHKHRQQHIDNKNMAEGRGDKDVYNKEIAVLMTLCRVILEMKISRIANWKYPLILSRKHRDNVEIGNTPHSKGCVAPIVHILATECIQEIANDVNTILPATGHLPSLHLTADKGDGLGQKVEFGRIVYYSNDAKDIVSKPLICNVLSYKNGEKSGGAKELAAGYRKAFDSMRVFDIKNRWKSTVFDNEYHEKKVTKQIEIQYGLQNKSMFIQFRDHNHNMNLVWIKLYDNSSFSMIVITNQRSIVTALNHGAVVMLKAADLMSVAALKCPGHSITKWMENQIRSISNYIWMLPSLYRVYKLEFAEKHKNKSDQDAMNKEAKKIYDKLMNIKCGQNAVGKRLVNDIGAPYKWISLENQTFRHEPWELKKEANYLINDTRFRMDKVDEQIANYERCIIPQSLLHKYPSTASLYIDGDKIRVKMDMRKLNKSCPIIKSCNKPKKISENEWNKKINDRNKLRERIIELNNDYIIDPTKCILPIHKFCKLCGLSSYLCPLIECENCNELSHLQCNGITNKSVEYYTGNEIEFYCVLNECNKLLKPLKSNENHQCDATMNYFIKELKYKLKKDEIVEELKHHNIYNERYRRSVVFLRKKLINHYKDQHFIKYQKIKKKQQKKTKTKKTEYIVMNIDDFCKWIHREHKKMLTTILEALYHYVDRVPVLCEIAGRCFDFKCFRKEIMDEFGRIFTKYIETKKMIRRLKKIQSGEEQCDMDPEKASNLLSEQKQILSDLKKCKSIQIKIDCIISGGLPAFLELVEKYNHDHDDPKDLVLSQQQYVLFLSKIFYMLCSKQLVFRWCNNKKDKDHIYKLSHDLTDVIMSEPDVYEGCQCVIHIYEIIVAGDACEPNLEADISLFNLRCHGRNSLEIKKYHEENILVTECKDEQSEKTTKIIRAGAVTYRADHSSPFISNGKYKLSPSVDPYFWPKKPEKFVLYLPKSLGGKLDSISKLVKKSSSYIPLKQKSSHKNKINTLHSWLNKKKVPSINNKNINKKQSLSQKKEEDDHDIDDIDDDGDVVMDLVFNGNVQNIQTKGGDVVNIIYREQFNFDENTAVLFISYKNQIWKQEGNDEKEDK